MTQETWFLTESGVAVDPNEVAPDETGRLRHASGYVAMRGGAYSSRGMSAEEIAAARKPKEPKAPKGYKTREAKAD